jgi:hypothetical protein
MFLETGIRLYGDNNARLPGRSNLDFLRKILAIRDRAVGVTINPRET